MHTINVRENTIFTADMGLPLRITYNNNDIKFTLLTEKPSTGVGDLEILIDGNTHRLRRFGNDWAEAGETTLLDSGLVKAIGKAIALRYRL
ncbi:hypothetical protein GCM10023149_02140 [Mucilaginibacter gynuensis]|uniref:Uncharacterized protein n=1 Tax=Mucilaginibacter gynuensis TaxID=1302236 RepID=A0ABP8FPB2_9SPHI